MTSLNLKETAETFSRRIKELENYSEFLALIETKLDLPDRIYPRPDINSILIPINKEYNLGLSVRIEDTCSISIGNYSDHYTGYTGFIENQIIPLGKYVDEKFVMISFIKQYIREHTTAQCAVSEAKTQTELLEQLKDFTDYISKDIIIPEDTVCVDVFNNKVVLYRTDSLISVSYNFTYGRYEVIVGECFNGRKNLVLDRYTDGSKECLLNFIKKHARDRIKDKGSVDV